MNTSIRIASNSDADLLLEWRNNPIVRQFSKSSGLIHREEHLAWLKIRLTKCEKEPFFIFMIGDIAAGTARLDKVIENEKILNLSILLGPQYQGSGNGRVLLNLVYNFAIERLGVEAITADIHPENLRSIKLFQAEGFNHVSQNGVFHRYQKMQTN